MSDKWSSPSSLKWKRPETLAMPTIWATFEGKPLPNGQIPKFRIQDITDDLIEPVVIHMKTNFLVDEPYCRLTSNELKSLAAKYIGEYPYGMACEASSDPLFVEGISQVWRWVLSHRIAIVCLLENANELEDKTLPSIAGCNLTYPIFPDSPDITVSHAPVNYFFDMVTKTLQMVDCFAKYNVPVIMYALGLSVDRAYRGHGIGEKLLKARFPLGRALGIKVTNVVFSGNFSQAAGRKAGYEALGEILAEDYLVDGKPIYQGVKDSRCMQLQAIVIPKE